MHYEPPALNKWIVGSKVPKLYLPVPNIFILLWNMAILAKPIESVEWKPCGGGCVWISMANQFVVAYAYARDPPHCFHIIYIIWGGYWTVILMRECCKIVIIHLNATGFSSLEVIERWWRDHLGNLLSAFYLTVFWLAQILRVVNIIFPIAASLMWKEPRIIFIFMSVSLYFLFIDRDSVNIYCLSSLRLLNVLP